MSPMVESPSPRRTVSRIALPLLAVLVSGAALAGPTDPNHRFERIGFSVGDVAQVVRMPGEMRALVVSKGGEVYRAAGDRHVLEYLGTIPATQTCGTDGVMGAAWDAATETLFAVYTAAGGASGRVLRVARFSVVNGSLGPEVRLIQPNEIPIAAGVGCTNLGGGITVASDGRVFVGVGDMGSGASAGQPSSVLGKILRLEPTGGPAADNPSATSPVYSLGVRNPVRLAHDPFTGNTWFIDVGPDMNDELNWISGPMINYAWPRASGPFETLGFRDPAYTWATAINPVGLVVNRGANFGAAWDGSLLVAAANGTMQRVHPVDLAATPPLSSATVIFTPGTGDPTSFASAFTLADGAFYVATASGEISRLRNDRGAIHEPSDRDAIVPTLVRKLSGGSIEILTERESATRYGFYPGSLDALYSHFGGTPLPEADACPDTTGSSQGCLAASALPGSAWSAITLSPSQVAAMPDAAYFVLSAISNRGESAVGVDSMDLARPGGSQSFGCPCPDGLDSGAAPGDCLPSYTMDVAIAGQAGTGFNTIDDIRIIEDFDCNVVLLELSMEWCPPCRAMAAEAEALWQDHISDPFTMIHVLSEDAAGATATNPGRRDIAERWTRDFGLTFPVVSDDNYELWNSLAQTNSIPQIFLIGKDGVVTDRWQGYIQHSVIEAAIQRELAR